MQTAYRKAIMELIKLIIVMLLSFLGGVVQTVTGFGGGIVMMLVFPYFFDITKAPALSAAIGMALSGSLTIKFRKKIDFRKSSIPTVLYVIISQIAILLIRYLDMKVIGLVYGGFLIALALYYFFLAKRIRLREGTGTMLFATGVSGLASGFFGIGGPLMAVYYSNILPLGEVYIASTQFNFFMGSILSFVTRILRGIYTIDLLSYTILGIAAIIVGRQVGLRIARRINGPLLKKIIYVFVAVSGVITILK